jgi:5-dehydro-2-deoxygluconokinase
MPLKNSRQLYILPFDHRASFFRDLFGWKEPLSKARHNKVKEAKQIIWYAFVRVWAKCKGKCNGDMGILVDEEFGTEILHAAKKLGAVRILTTEKSGQNVFDFEYGVKFGQHILKFKPDYAKVLVRYNPVNKKDNLVQLKRLKKISDFCIQKKIGFLFELLVPASLSQAKKYGKKYDFTARPALTLLAIKEIQAAGIRPVIWKLEAMSRNYWPKVIKAAGKAQIVILGRAGSKALVSQWLKTAAKFKEVIGFAVGRTIFFQPLEQWRDKKINKDKAINLIASNFEYFINLWERAKKL